MLVNPHTLGVDIEHKFRHFFKTLHQCSYTRMAHTCTRESAVHTSAHTTFLTKKHRKNTHESQNFCAWYLNTKDWLTLNKDQLKNNNIHLLVWKHIRIRLYTVLVYKYNVITFLWQLVSMYSSISSFDKENTAKIV